MTLYEGQKYTLPCEAFAYPEPTYVWLRNGHLVADVDVKALVNNYLLFSKAKLSHSGWYTCTASNIYGSVSHSVYVNVVSGMLSGWIYKYMYDCTCTHVLDIYSYIC